MNKNFLLNAFFIALIAFLSLNLFSCTTSKNIKYFQDIPDSGKTKPIPGVAYIEPVIQVDDILTILVQTIDVSAVASINSGNISSANTGTMVGTPTISQQTTLGYLVDKAGFVDLPIIGKIKVVGYTTSQVKKIIYDESLKYFKDPTVSVRFANFKVSVAGEVVKPGTYILPNEKVTLLDALTLAGDLTIYGKRDNVLLIREEADGSKTPYRINLKKSEIMSAPYYYLRQNDYIYVEPNKGKAAANDASQARTYTIIGTLLSVLIIFLSRR